MKLFLHRQFFSNFKIRCCFKWLNVLMKRVSSWAMLTKDTDCEVEHEVFLTGAKSKARASMLVYSALR